MQSLLTTNGLTQNQLHQWKCDVFADLTSDNELNFPMITGVLIDWLIDWAWFNVSTNTVYVIRAMVFTGQKTQPTVSKYWRNTKNTQLQKKYNKNT